MTYFAWFQVNRSAFVTPVLCTSKLPSEQDLLTTDFAVLPLPPCTLQRSLPTLKALPGTAS